MKKLFIHLTLLIIASLGDNVFCQQIPVLNLTPALEHPQNITLGDFIESVTYIPLATSYDNLVDKNPKVYVTKEYTLAVTQNRCLLFNRKTGSFIREIGNYGRGPGEFRGATLGFVNDLLPACYFMGWNGNLIKYTIDGIFRGNVKIPGYKDDLESPSFPMNYSFLNDSIIVCDFLIATGTEPKSLMIFNENGKELKVIPNRDILKTKRNFVLRTGETSYYYYNNSLFFQSMYNDTVFQISVDKITPHFILNRGKHSPPFESKWWTFSKQQQSGLISQPDYFENKRFISFNFYSGKNKYFALYDKTKKSLKVSENTTGIKNDLDGFIDLSFASINSDGELIGIIEANDLVKWIEMNPGKLKAFKPELQKLQNIKMEDNPVVVIAKYKR